MQHRVLTVKKILKPSQTLRRYIVRAFERKMIDFINTQYEHFIPRIFKYNDKV